MVLVSWVSGGLRGAYWLTLATYKQFLWRLLPFTIAASIFHSLHPQVFFTKHGQKFEWSFSVCYAVLRNMGNDINDRNVAEWKMVEVIYIFLFLTRQSLSFKIWKHSHVSWQRVDQLVRHCGYKLTKRIVLREKSSPSSPLWNSNAICGAYHTEYWYSKDGTIVWYLKHRLRKQEQIEWIPYPCLDLALNPDL